MKIDSRRGVYACATMACFASCATAPAWQEATNQRDRITNLSVLVGLREFDEDDWEPVEQQTGFGLEVDSRTPDAPVGWEVGVSYSSDDDDDFDPFLGDFSAEAEFIELYGGVRKTWDTSDGRVHPYVAGGLTYIDADVDVEVVGMGEASEDDSSIGAYVHGGVTFDVTRSLLIGADLRAILGTDLDFAGVDGDADYIQAAVLVGFSF